MLDSLRRPAGRLRVLARCWFTVALVAVFANAARDCWAALPAWLAPITQTSEPFIGVTYYQITQSLNSPTPYVLPREVSLHIVEIDPTAPGVSFLGTPGNGTTELEYTRRTTSSFVNANDLAVGINGDFYDTSTGINTNVIGLGMSNGEVVSAAASGWHSFITRADNTATIVSNGTVPANAWNAVSGNQRIVTNGVNVAPNDTYTNTLNPHTAVGIGADGKVFFMVVDGRQGDFSKGMYTSEMANIFIDFGVRNAINLDGGGSSALVFGDGTGGAARTINSPSDGSSEQSPGGERSVANHFGVYAMPNPNYVRLTSPPRPGTPTPDPLITTLTVLDGFDGNEGRYATAPTFSGTNRGIAATTTADYSTEAAHQGAGSEKLTIVRDAQDVEGRLRFLAGGGTPANNRVTVGSQQRAMGTTGFVGFFLKTDDAGLTVNIGLDDGYRLGTTGMEISTALPVIADGKWHLYQWNLADANLWSNFTAGNGTINGPNSFIDSIFINGGAPNQTSVVFLDTVAYNPAGNLNSLIVPEVFRPADFNRDGRIDGGDLTVWRNSFGFNANADANGDGVTDGADFLLWQRSAGAPGAEAAVLNVPEPVASLLGTTGAVGLWARRRRNGAGSGAPSV
ncbi:phosphodiester glycosidase family protein [Lacipirellula sp.]|uniref:phosphodiester glycosidase family protein n=1 Tax=Lacipirellula sp. TaxID=2691419 RepID=UPI003D0F6B44